MTWNRSRVRLFFLGILALMIITAIYDFPFYYNRIAETAKKQLKIPLFQVNPKPFSLGLDLQGGSHLVYQADVSGVSLLERGQAIEGVKDVLDRRVNAFGVSEPLIQSSGGGDNWKVIVELAGVHDINKAIQMIGETPQLNFMLEATTTEPILIAEEKKQLEDFNKTAKIRAEGILKKALDTNADIGGLAKEFSEEPAAKNSAGILGFQKRGVFVKEFEKACFDDLQADEISKNLVQTLFGYHIIKKIDERESGEKYEANCQHILVRTKTASDIHPVPAWTPTKLSGEHLKSSQVVFDPNTGWAQVGLEFNSEGKEIFKDLTTQNVGKPIGIFLDGNIISAPRVNEPIIAGNAVISGDFSVEEAKLLAQRLNAGALRVPIKLVSQQTIGPSLGKISVERSINAALVGLIVVSIFMILFYRVPGLLACIALLTYGFIILALFKFIPVTLSLPGIFGFILSIGMAVDANILVFERMKEEIRRGKALEDATNEAFKRAWPSIRDGNYSTLITSAVLFWFSTSIIKGFALTLGIGIFVSMFTAMFTTRVFLKMIVKVGNKKWLWLYGVKKKEIAV